MDDIEFENAEWQGDWEGLAKFARDSIPTGMFSLGDGLTFAAPVPKGMEIRIGRTPEFAVPVGEVALGDLEAPDFGRAVRTAALTQLNKLSEERSQASLSLFPVYDDDVETKPNIAPCIRTFTRRAPPATTTSVLKDTMSTMAQATRQVLNPPSYPQEEEGIDPWASTHEPQPVSPQTIEEAMITRTFAILEREVNAQRRVSEDLMRHMFTLFGGVVENSSRDAERFGAEAAQARVAHVTTDKALSEAKKEAEVLETHVEFLKERVEELEAELELAERRRKKAAKAAMAAAAQAGGDAPTNMIQQVIAQTIQAMSGSQGGQTQQAPVAPPAPKKKKKKRRPIPGAPMPKRRMEPDYEEDEDDADSSGGPEEAPAPAPPSGGGGGLGGFASSLLGGLGGVDSGTIANVIGNLPTGMRDEIVKSLVAQNPKAAVELGEVLYKTTEAYAEGKKKKGAPSKADPDEDGEEFEEDDEDEDEDEDFEEDDDDDVDDYLDDDDDV